MVQVLATIGYVVVLLFIMAMFVRVVFDVIQIFARDWRPSGLALVLAEVVYTVTDPPLRAFRRLIPPLRIGQVSFDLAFLIIMLLSSLLLGVMATLAS